MAAVQARVGGPEGEGEEVRIRVRREAVVSAGAVGSAQLLLLSGIGPRDQLEKVGVTRGRRGRGECGGECGGGRQGVRALAREPMRSTREARARRERDDTTTRF